MTGRCTPIPIVRAATCAVSSDTVQSPKATCIRTSLAGSVGERIRDDVTDVPGTVRTVPQHLYRSEPDRAIQRIGIRRVEDEPEDLERRSIGGAGWSSSCPATPSAARSMSGEIAAECHAHDRTLAVAVEEQFVGVEHL